MPRRGSAGRRETPPDIRYNNVLVAKLIRKVMRSGKLSVAESLVYGAFDLVEERLKRHPVQVFEQALRNATPALEVKPRRVGGATYQVPMEVRPERRLSLALRWLVLAARKRPAKSMAERLAAELMDAFNQTGAAVKKKEDTHRMAEANKAFAHYRW